MGVFRRGDIVWELDLKEGIDFAIYVQGGFEPETLRYYRGAVRPGFVVLDIGANIGSHTLPLAQIVGPSGRVHSFEPTDYAFGKQLRNVSLNPELSKRVNPTQAMLVARSTQENARRSHPAGPSTAKMRRSAIRFTWADSTPSKARTFSAWTTGSRKSNHPMVDFVKMDVDGYEIDVIEGARETLSRFSPIMMMEFAPYIFPREGKVVHRAIGCAYGFGIPCAHGKWKSPGPGTLSRGDDSKSWKHERDPRGSMSVVSN